MTRSFDAISAQAALLRLATIIEQREPRIHEHSQRVTGYLTAFAIHLNLPNRDVEVLERAAMLHDVGMALVPDHILRRPGPLTDAEVVPIRQHTVVVSQLCEQVPELAPLVPILRSHHERLNGSGYPDGLRSDGIPLLAQILGIVDAYDAMTAANAHQPVRTSEEALQELQLDVKRGWRSRRLVDEFIALVRTEHLSTPANPYVASVRDALNFASDVGQGVRLHAAE